MTEHMTSELDANRASAAEMAVFTEKISLSDFYYKFGSLIYRRLDKCANSKLTDSEQKIMIQIFAVFIYFTQQGHMDTPIDFSQHSIQINSYTICGALIAASNIRSWLLDVSMGASSLIIIQETTNNQVVLSMATNTYYKHIVSTTLDQRLATSNLNAAYLKSTISVICGPAGSGKTNASCHIILEQLQQHPNLKICVAAPTGKAAQNFQYRLQSIISNTGNPLPNITCSTLHALLGIAHTTPYIYSGILPAYDLIIIDECSMIGYPIMAHLLTQISEHTGIILVGDPNQIPSIDQGTPFKDIIAIVETKAPQCVIKLTSPNRFNHEIGELLTLHPIITPPLIFQAHKHSPNIFKVIPIYSYKEFVQKLFEIISDAFYYEEDPINNEDIECLLHKINDTIILSPNRQGILGATKLNQALCLLWREKHRVAGRNIITSPVIITKNIPLLSVYNGTQGILLQDINLHKNGEGIVYIMHNQKIVKFDARQLIYVELAFANTIHKSQGSEYKHVIVIISKNEGITNPAIFHTAFTRAKQTISLFYEHHLYDKLNQV